MPGSPILPRDDLYARIVQALIDARHEAKLRQVDVAKRVGWPQAYVSRYENHERKLDVAEFVAVALAVDADPMALLAQALDEG
ncbi:MAG TPA: helix-turn-helix transcriptional regulator [Sphingomonas sp.]|jgi:transcriptional regulator with XRE-family HTH domain